MTIRSQIIGIIGEGKMGTNLIHYLTEFGFMLHWVVSPEADISRIRRNFEKKVRRLAENDIIPAGSSDLLYQTTISSDISTLSDCDLVIEAITEDEAQKKKVLSLTDGVLKPDSILVSNSSSINPSVLCPSKSRESRFAGLHFFYPVNIANIVEIIKSPETSDITTEKLIAFLNVLGRKFIMLNEQESFILNRIFLDVQNEAFRIVDRGQASYAGIDRIVKKSLFPSGIFEFFDHVGLDTMLQSINNYTRDYPHSDYYRALISKLETLTSNGFLGRKSGRGFFDYTGNEPTVSRDQESPEQDEEIRNHLAFTYKNAARRLITHSGLTIDELNEALKEYFGTDKGPFE